MSTSHIRQKPENAEDKIKRYTEAAGAEVKNLLSGAGNLVMLEVVAGALLLTIGIPVPGLGFPYGLLVLLALALFRLSKPAQYEVAFRSAFFAVIFVGLAYVAVASLNFGISTPNEVFRRVARISILLLVLYLIADRRIHFRSLIVGLAIALVFNALAFYAGIAPDTYAGALTGWLPDKNVSGLYYGFVPILLFGIFTQTRHRIIILLFFIPMLWNTGSRTSMAALMIGVLWILFAEKANFLIKLGLAFFSAWFFDWLQVKFADHPIFGDRSGTDFLRERIDEASLEKVEAAPWSGWGFGQATVQLGESTFFFHNSYWTLLVEGGWLWLLVVVSLTVVAVVLVKQPYEKESGRIALAEGLTVYLAVCSWRLGEVMLTLPWVFAVGLALALVARPKKSSGFENNLEGLRNGGSI